MYNFKENSARSVLFHRYFYDNSARGEYARYAYSFRGPRFFSYSTVIGLTVTGNDGAPVLLYSFYSMTNTTAGHISALVRACPFEDDHKIAVPFKYGCGWVSEAGEVARRFGDWFSEFDEKALKYTDSRRDLLRMTAAARRFSDLVYKLPAALWRKIKKLAAIAEDGEKRLRDRREAAANRTPEDCARLAVTRARREAREAEKRAALIAEYTNQPYMRQVHYLVDRFSGIGGEARAALREKLEAGRGYCSFVDIDARREQIVTSQGVRLSLSTVRRLLSLWLRGRVLVGQHVGPYSVREFGADFVQIGCHKIPVENLRALAAVLLPSSAIA